MGAAPYLSLILPAYNERERIERTLDEVRQYLDGQPYLCEIIVVADGDDGTREAVVQWSAGDPRVTVIGHRERRGKGRGIREGVALARGEIIGFADADAKTPIEELANLLPWFDAGYDLVIGSRALAESRIERAPPRYRRIGSRAFALIMRAITGLHGISDTQCGFKFFRGEVARTLFRYQRIDGYMFDVEILCLAARMRYRIKEVGVRWRNDGDSRYNPIGGTLRNAKELLRIGFAVRLRQAETD